MTGPVSVHALGDGLLVRLAGDLGPDALPQLRGALLAPPREGYVDMVVDAGEVTSVDDGAVGQRGAPAAFSAC